VAAMFSAPVENLQRVQIAFNQHFKRTY